MSAQEKDPESPATTSLAYDAMLPTWNKVQTVLDGTQAMRAAGETYLPQHEGESDTAYKERRDRCTLLNRTKLTLNTWVGMPFSEPIAFDGVPSSIEPWLDDVDLVGSDVHVFSRDWFSDGVAKSHSHVLVDFPRTDPNPDGTPRTLADDENEGVRPYWVHIRPENLLFANAEMVDGKEVLREIRILEHITERDGFAETCTVQIRQITTNPDPKGGCVVTLYRPDPTKKKKDKIVWVQHGQPYEMSLKVIPLVTFYSDRDSFMLGTPPLADLADLNIAHWQSTSDQRAVLTVARFPILALSGGVDKDKKLTVGPNQWLWSPDPQGKFYYVEHTGAAIESGRKDLESLEQQMAEYGGQFLKKAPNPTATARLLDSAEATSPLQDMVKRFGYALNQALELTAAWIKVESGGTAIVATDFTPETADDAKLNTLRETRKMKDISREAYLEQLMTWGVLPEDYDAEEDATALEQEATNLFGMPPEPDPDVDPNEGDDDDVPGGEEEDEE